MFPIYDGSIDVNVYVKQLYSIIKKKNKINYKSLLSFLNTLFDTNFPSLLHFKNVPETSLTTNKEIINNELNKISYITNDIKKKKNIISIIRFIVKKNGYKLYRTSFNNNYYFSITL